jgi:LPXTG-motif cell wall-anchored protein
MACAVLASAQDMPKTTTEKIAGAAQVGTEHLRGTVQDVSGNDLIVKMSNGSIREFHVPESRVFNIDGKQLTVHDLKPGTTLSATVTTTITPVTDRTTTIGTGKVWYVAGNTVILTLPNGENKMYTVNDSYKFTVDGQPASVHDLRKGMTISAVKIVESERTEIATNTDVTGHFPVKAADTSTIAPTPRPARTTTATVAPTPAPAPTTPAVTASPTTPSTSSADRTAPEPEALPKTASSVPLLGLLGIVLVGAGLTVRRWRLQN